MKTVYSNYVYKFIMYLGILVLLIAKYFLFLADDILDTILFTYYLLLVVFCIVLLKNKAAIEKNIDEMVKYVESKVNSIIIFVSQVFLLILICLLIAPFPFIQSIPIDRQTVSLVIISYLAVIFLLRIFLFKYYDGKEY